MRPLLWIPMFILRMVCFVLGLAMVPLMLFAHNNPAWLFRPWYNPEEGLDAPDWYPAYIERRRKGPVRAIARRFPRFWWNAIRNPSNGLRTYPWLTCQRDLMRLEWKDNNMPTNPGPLRAAGGRIGWFYCWQGLYSGIWVCVIWNAEKHMKLRWGWKLVPEEGQFEKEWKPTRAGFAMSTLLWRNG